MPQAVGAYQYRVGSPSGWTTCPNCGVPWQQGLKSCQNCRQADGLPTGVVLATAGRRLGGYALDVAMFIVTGFIGYFIWVLIVSKDGQTPGKQLLGTREVQTATRRKATWGTSMLRELLRWLVGFVASWTLFGFVLLFWLFFNKDLQELWDLAAGTVVVDDRNHVMLGLG
jgi:uncharacterized RDD family membrane protein YckC